MHRMHWGWIGLVVVVGWAGGGEPTYQAGLLSTWVQGDRRFDRVDDDVSFVWEDGRADARLAGGPFEVEWRGVLFVPQPGTFRFHLFAAGEVSLLLAGREVLAGRSERSGWIDSDPTPIAFGYYDVVCRFRSKGSSGRIGWYWSSDTFEREPIPSRQLFHIADRLRPDGASLARQGRCAACHALDQPSLRAPALVHVRDTLHRDWLATYLSTAEGHRPGYLFDERQSAAVAAFLASVSEPVVLATEPSGDADRGVELIESIGCLACHQWDGVGSKDRLGGGELSNLGLKRPAGYFDVWLRDPASIQPSHRMPTFPLVADERRDVCAALAKGARGVTASTSDRRDQIEQGRALVEQHRCASCHSIAGLTSPGLVAMDGQGPDCLGEPTADRLGYRWSAEDADAARAYVRGVVRATEGLSSDMLGRRVMAENLCLGCHPRGRSNGLREVVAELGTTDAREQVVKVAPSLTSVGDKLHEAWLRRAVSGEAAARRPWLKPRMPRYAHAGPDHSSLMGYLVGHDRLPTYGQPGPPKRGGKDALAAAKQLIGPAGFGCMSCHGVGNYEPIGGEPSARGPNLAKLDERVRYEWYRRWTRQSARIVPGVEMPAINLAIPSVLDGTVETQLAALWQGLCDPKFKVPEATAVDWLTALGRDRPLIFRDIVEHAPGDFTSRSFGIGFPNGHNLLIDLDRFVVRRWWLGDFASEHTRGKSWYWQTLGTTLWDAKEGTLDWRLERGGQRFAPQSGRQSVVDVRQWRGDERRVELIVRLHFGEAGSVEVAMDWRSTPTGLLQHWNVTGLPEGGRLLVGLPPTLTVPPSTTSVLRVTPTGLKDVSGDGYWAMESSSASVQWERQPTEELTSIVASPGQARGVRKELAAIPGYEVVRLGVGDGPMPTALAVRRDGSLLVASLKGGVFSLRDTDGDGEVDSYRPYVVGFASPFGLLLEGDDVLLAHKHELVRMRDTDGDDRADMFQVVASGWGVTSDYHDWMVGPARDGKGGYLLALSCQQDKRSAASAIGRGKLLRTQEDGSFSMEAHGLRFPMGLAINSAGDLFATDNQGVTNPFNELNHLRPGRHYGFLNALEERASEPVYESAAVQIPHPWTGSVNGLTLITNDAFGPYVGHFLGAEYTTRRLIRMSVQPFGSTYQGCVYPFGEADQKTTEEDRTFLGPMSLAMDKDVLYVGSIIDSGWGGGNNRGTIERVRRSGKLPFGIREVRAWERGFDIDFSGEVDIAKAQDPAGYTLSSYRRVHVVGYATPDRDRKPARVIRAEPASDRKSVRLTLEEMRPGFVYDVAIGPIGPDDVPAYPTIAFYTLNTVPPGSP